MQDEFNLKPVWNMSHSPRFTSHMLWLDVVINSKFYSWLNAHGLKGSIPSRVLSSVVQVKVWVL